MKFWCVALVIYLVTIALGICMMIYIFPEPTADEDETQFYFNDVDDVSNAASKEFIHYGWASMTFKESILEVRWRKKSVAELLRTGSLMLVAVTMFMIFKNLFRLYLTQNIACYQSEPWYFEAVHMVVLLMVLAGAIVCSRGSALALYWVIFAFYCLYIPGVSLPPIDWSCSELKACAENVSEFNGLQSSMAGNRIWQAVHHADCSLEGRTSMQFLVTWLLLTPWLVDRLEILNIGWFWIFGVFVGWSLSYGYITGEHVFDKTDTAVRAVLLSVALAISINIKYWLDKHGRLHFLQNLHRREASKKMYDILELMMPVHVVRPMIMNPDIPIADKENRVTILFILIGNFDIFAREKTPSQLLSFLNEQFTNIDDILQMNRVQKIETVGEEYVACVGIRENGDHGFALLRLFKAAGEILQNQTDDVKRQK
jgi:hypothetical protein